MTTTTFPAEPANNTFAVWFDANNDPYFTYYREDAHSNGYDHWFNADQHDTGDDDEPKTWAELCDEAYGMRGPVLLVPADLLTQSREQAATYANEIGTLTAENARLRQQRDAHAEVVKAIDSLLMVTDCDPLGDHGIAIPLGEIRRVLGKAREAVTR